MENKVKNEIADLTSVMKVVLGYRETAKETYSFCFQYIIDFAKKIAKQTGKDVDFEKTGGICIGQGKYPIVTKLFTNSGNSDAFFNMQVEVSDNMFNARKRIWLSQLDIDELVRLAEIVAKFNETLK